MTKLWLRIISVVEIVGGVSGVIMFALEALRNPAGSPAVMALYLVLIGMYLLSLYAGVALWLGRPAGRNASIVVQALQLPKIISPLIVFMVSFGFDLYFYVVAAGVSNQMGFDIKLLAFSQLHFNVEDAPLGFGISLVSCVFLAMLVRYEPAIPLPESEQAATEDDVTESSRDQDPQKGGIAEQ